MHRYTDESERLFSLIESYVRDRISQAQPLDAPLPLAELRAEAGASITRKGLGGDEAMRLWAEVLAPACVSTDHPANLAFVPGAPTRASILFDLVVGASSIIGAAWLDASGAIFAENEALRWLADVAGMPATAGGVFVSGGSAANLSALVTARHVAATRRTSEGRKRPARWRVAASEAAHSSVPAAARVMDAGVLSIPVDGRGRLTGDALARGLDDAGNLADDLCAVAATGGTTNVGIVDDLAGVADVCAERGLWLHVDAAYGGAALIAPDVAPLFEGIERADSITIDPHKWLFAPYDCAALLYREPSLAPPAHAQEAEYLGELHEDPDWSPMNYAFHLTRRARGLPFWFSLAVHGTDAYRIAVEQVLQVTRATADEIRSREELELLLEPELSVVVFRRREWTGADYDDWSERAVRAQVGYCYPTTWQGEKVMRMCFVNPETTIAHVRTILDSMG